MGSVVLVMDKELYEKRIDQFRILDDTFMNEVFRDQNELVQMVLRTILRIQDLEVTEVAIQDSYTNMQGRGIRIDVAARDSSGRLYDLEIQRAKHGAGAKRARYNMSLLDVSNTKEGTVIPDPAETYIIFITETDVFNEGLPIYHIERMILEMNQLFNDQGHIVYVNGAYVGEDPIGVLMHDFRCSDPNKIRNELLRKRVSNLKNSPEWRETMCQAMEDTREEGRIEGRLEGQEETKVRDYYSMLALGVEESAVRMGLGITDELLAKYPGFKPKQ